MICDANMTKNELRHLIVIHSRLCVIENCAFLHFPMLSLSTSLSLSQTEAAVAENAQEPAALYRLGSSVDTVSGYCESIHFYVPILSSLGTQM